MCFCSQDYYRNKGCIYHILNSSVASVASGRSSSTHFFFSSKVSISEHSSSIGICLKKGEKSLLFIFLSAKGAEGGGVRAYQTCQLKSQFCFTLSLNNFLFFSTLKKVF